MGFGYGSLFKISARKWPKKSDIGKNSEPKKKFRIYDQHKRSLSVDFMRLNVMSVAGV